MRLRATGETYAQPEENERRYSPAECTGAVKVLISGNPDEAKICTSHVERQNLTMRMQMRRLTRLTNAFSKKLSNHRAAVALHFAWYNWCQPHGSLKGHPGHGSGHHRSYLERERTTGSLAYEKEVIGNGFNARRKITKGTAVLGSILTTFRCPHCGADIVRSDTQAALWIAQKRRTRERHGHSGRVVDRPET